MTTADADKERNDLDAELDRWFDRHRGDLVALRRDIHAHPELSGDEHRTTELVAGRLTDAGYDVRRLAVGTGLIADAGARPGKRPGGQAGDHLRLLAVRADLDALPLTDEKDAEYRSTVHGVSHACGHDVHTTVALGTALFFADHPELAENRLRFVFQPAEERVPGGALDVIRDRGLEGVDTVIGFHCEPKLDVGLVGLRVGAITSASDMAVIHIEGPGGHTARPELTVDMIAVAAKVVLELPALVSAITDGAEAKVVFGAIRAGEAANVIPTKCELRASIRTPSLGAWETLEHTVVKSVATILDGTGASHRIEYTRGVPPTINDRRVVDAVREAARRTVGDESIVLSEQSWGGDDFAWMTREVPGAYVRLGVHDPSLDQQLDLHAGHFDVDERAIEIGVRLLAHVASATNSLR